MRKREQQTKQAEPKPCGHRLVTMAGKTQYACLWGQSQEYPLMCDAPEWEAVEAAEREHTRWAVSGTGLQLVVREELLGPSGEPYPG